MTRSVIGIVAVVAMLVAAPAAAAADRLPDLRMAQLTDIHIDNTGGKRLLRFTTLIVNVGAGPFEARGSRPNRSQTNMNVTQRIYATGGGFRDVSTSATMFFAGDGHHHWHTKDLVRAFVTPLGGGASRDDAKIGYCFFDDEPFRLSLPGAPHDVFYKGCGGDPNRLHVTTGLSVGWGDSYASIIPLQYIDITNLPDGSYRLRANSDQSNWFAESNNGNNFTYTDIRIVGSTVTVLGVGSHA